MDSRSLCRDTAWFDLYPHRVHYQFNSRGFRDQEWPEQLSDLKQALWCVGDSFTVGIGSTWEHTWPYLLSHRLSCRTINISLDGASNSWIARTAQRIIDAVEPDAMIMQWSYVTREESNDTDLTDEDRRMHFLPQHLASSFDGSYETRFRDTVNRLQRHRKGTRLLHSFVPDYGLGMLFDPQKVWLDVKGPDWPCCPMCLQDLENLSDLVLQELTRFGLYQQYLDHMMFFDSIEHVSEIQRMDLARDGHHYGPLTAQRFVDDVVQLLMHGAV